jgi:hypothetical protein
MLSEPLEPSPLTREEQQLLEPLVRRRAERLAREEQQFLDRAADLRLPRVPSDDEVMRLAGRDPAAALALLDDFGRAWWKTVDRLVDEKARALVDSGEYGDPDDYYHVVGELPDGRIEIEYDGPSETAEDDATDWLRGVRPDLYAERERVTHLAADVARFTRVPSRVRAVLERSPFSWSFKCGLAARRFDRRGMTGRVRSRRSGRPRARGAGRPAGRRVASRASGSGDDGDSDPSDDGESGGVGAALVCARRASA